MRPTGIIIVPMITTVTQKNTITIPAEIGRRYGIKPGYRLDWQVVEGKEEILIRVIPDRAELARRRRIWRSLASGGHQTAKAKCVRRLHRGGGMAGQAAAR